MASLALGRDRRLAAETLALLAPDGRRRDLLVTDVMPGMSGVELAHRVRAARPGTAVLFLSGYTSDALRERGIAARRAWHVQKPFTAGELLAEARRAPAQRSGGTPAR